MWRSTGGCSAHVISASPSTPAQLGPGERNLFPEIEPRRELGDRRLPLADHTRGRRCLQPPGQLFLADPGARNREQLKERTPPEQIQIGRIRMRRIGESIARLAATGPQVVDPSEPPLVEDARARRAITQDDDAVVPPYQPDERANRRDGPRPGKGFPEGGHHHRRQPRKHGQAQIAEAGVGCGELRVGGSPGVKAGDILGTRREHACILPQSLK